MVLKNSPVLPDLIPLLTITLVSCLLLLVWMYLLPVDHHASLLHFMKDKPWNHGRVSQVHSHKSLCIHIQVPVYLGDKWRIRSSWEELSTHSWVSRFSDFLCSTLNLKLWDCLLRRLNILWVHLNGTEAPRVFFFNITLCVCLLVTLYQ